MRKLYPSEKQVLARLIFPESYDVILEETGLAAGSLRDDLINLINYRLVEIVDPASRSISGSSFYDADNLQEYSFRATKLGIKHIREMA